MELTRREVEECRGRFDFVEVNTGEVEAEGCRCSLLGEVSRTKGVAAAAAAAGAARAAPAAASLGKRWRDASGCGRLVAPGSNGP